jgi:saccharopine dehydrogenase-like NADP-dependent oxidoreductase
MRVIVKGTKDENKITYQWDLYDEYDPATKVHSMARTTGYSATMAARMLLTGLYDQKGINPPEYLGRNERCVEFILDGLKERGVNYELTVMRDPD